AGARLVTVRLPVPPPSTVPAADYRFRGVHFLVRRSSYRRQGPREEDDVKYLMLIYQGSTPLPGTDAWNDLPEEEQQRIYADYGALNENPAVTPGLPMGLPENAT